MNIRIKIIAMSLILVLISVLSIGIITDIKSSEVMLNQTEDASLELVKSQKDNISEIIEKEGYMPKYLATENDVHEFLLAQGDKVKQEAVNKLLSQYADGKTNLEHAFLVNTKGIIVADSTPKSIGLNLANRKYSLDTFSTKAPQISETLKSRATGKEVVVFTNPVIDNATNEVQGYIATAIVAEGMANFIKEVRLNNTKSSYAYLVDETGNLIYHPTTSKIGKAVENSTAKGLIARIKNGESLAPEIIKYKYNGIMKIAAYAEVPKTRWLLIITGDANEIKAPAKAIGIFILLIGIIIMLLSSVIGVLVSNQISKPITLVTQLINKTAKLDLVYDSSFDRLVKKKDETGTMTRAMGEMRKALREMVALLHDSSYSIMENATKVEAITERVHENSSTNSATTEELSAGMEETAATTEEINASAEEIGRSVSSVASKTEEGSNLSIEITKRATIFKESAVESKRQADNVYGDVKAKMEDATKQSKEVEQIHSLADTILQITAQTNLLALNAAIEAARAGEAGKGFAVVADEIRKLALESSNAVTGIQKIVTTVYDAVNNMKLGSEKVLEFIDNDVKKDYENFITVCNKYDKDSLKVNEIMDIINGATHELTATMAVISSAITEVAETVGEGARGINDIADKTTDTVNLTEEVEVTAKESIKQAKILEEIIARFKIA